MDKVLCYSCNKTKNKLSVKKSALFQINLLMCETCISEKYEPRWTIILAGRQLGHEHVKEYILRRRYVGEEILASELLV